METYRLPDESGVFEIYMGLLSCMRHRGQEFYELQQQGRLAFLIMDEVDFVTGAYIDTIKKASREIFLKRNPRALRISAGCQGTLLSTDYDMLADELAQELGIEVMVDKNCHLAGFNGYNKGTGWSHDRLDSNRPAGRGRSHGNREHDGGGRRDSRREGRPDFGRRERR